MQTDPIGYEDQINLYAYAGNDPINLADPDGKTGRSIIKRPKEIRQDNDAAELIADRVAKALPKGKLKEHFQNTGDILKQQRKLKDTQERINDTESNSTDVAKPYKRPSGATTIAQRASVQGKPCVDCGEVTSKQVADHKIPLVKEYYETGKIDVTKMRSVEAVQPQCPLCSARQGAEMSRYSQQMKKGLGLE